MKSGCCIDLCWLVILLLLPSPWFQFYHHLDFLFPPTEFCTCTFTWPTVIPLHSNHRRMQFCVKSAIMTFCFWYFLCIPWQLAYSKVQYTAMQQQAVVTARLSLPMTLTQLWYSPLLQQEHVQMWMLSAASALVNLSDGGATCHKLSCGVLLTLISQDSTRLARRRCAGSSVKLR